MSVQIKDNIGFFKFQDYIIQCKLNDNITFKYNRSYKNKNFAPLICNKLCVIKIFNYSKEIVNFIKNPNFISVNTNITINKVGNLIIDNIGIDIFIINTNDFNSKYNPFDLKIFKIYDLALKNVIIINEIKYYFYSNGMIKYIKFKDFDFENKNNLNYNLDLNTKKFDYTINVYNNENILSIYIINREKHYNIHNNNIMFYCKTINDIIHLTNKTQNFIYEVDIYKKDLTIFKIKKYKKINDELICFYKMELNNGIITIYNIDSDKSIDLKENKMKLIFNDFGKSKDLECFCDVIIKKHIIYSQNNEDIINAMSNKIKDAKEKLTQWFYEKLLTIK